jgi:hypothetical protein
MKHSATHAAMPPAVGSAWPHKMRAPCVGFGFQIDVFAIQTTTWKLSIRRFELMNPSQNPRSHHGCTQEAQHAPQ